MDWQQQDQEQMERIEHECMVAMTEYLRTYGLIEFSHLVDQVVAKNEGKFTWGG